MYLTARLRNFGTRDGAALKPRHNSSVQKYREKSGWNKEKTPEFWVWREKKRCFWGKYVILQVEKHETP